MHEGIEAADILAAIGRWSDGPGPLYERLADALEALLAAGALGVGARLPSERALADAAPVSRGTAVAAYGLLVERGWVQRTRGRGTEVVRGRALDRASPDDGIGLRAQSLTRRTLDPSAGEADGWVRLALTVLDDLDGLPEAAFALSPEVLGRASDGHGYAALGLPALRDRIAELFTSRGLPTVRDEVAITPGAQGALALVAGLLVQSGRTVAIEDPTYPGAIDAYARRGASFLALPIDERGVAPAHLDRVLDGTAEAVVHLATACNSPTGWRTPPERHAELGTVLARHGAWLVEDAALEHLVDGPPAYLAAMVPERSIVVGSVSKVFWGGLRVGWVRGPAGLIERLGRRRVTSDLGIGIPGQVIALRLLDELDRIATERRAEARRRRSDFVAHLGSWSERLGTSVTDVGGLGLWLPVHDGQAVAAEAAAERLDVVPGPVCSVRGEHRDRVRVSTWATPDVLAEGARRLRRALERAEPPTTGGR